MFSIAEIQKMNMNLSVPQIEGILHLILHNVGLTNTDLIRETGLPKETLRRFKSSISSLLDQEDSERILFKEDIKKELNSTTDSLELAPYKWSLLDYPKSLMEDTLKELRNSHSLEPKREYDQFFATEKTSVMKMQVMKDKGDIKGKRIALLGDDDLVSIVLGLSDTECSQITVLDVDKDILQAIDKIVIENQLTNIKTEFYDAKRDLRKDLQGRFDVVIIDPPYTLNGVKLFLNRSLELLGVEPNKSIYLYYGNSINSPEKTLQVQELLAKYNLLIRDKIENFARYYGAESIGSSSSLYLLQTLPATKRPFKEQITDIYTHQQSHVGEFPYVEHYVFKLYSVPESVIKSKSQLQRSLGKFCEYHKLKVMSTEVTRFPGGGFTFNYILANSNLTVHTWPELKALHFVLVTCEPVQKTERFYENLSSLFKTEKIEIERIE